MKSFWSNLLAYIASVLAPHDIPLDPSPVRHEQPVPTIPQPTEDPTPIPKTNREHLYDVARSYLGMDASPADEAPDEYGCADSVNQIYHKAFGEYISTPGISTAIIYRAMTLNAKFDRVSDPLPGDIIISPTGYSYLKNNPIKNGHTGIVGKNCIMSNNSSTGKWDTVYTLHDWYKRYERLGGYPVAFFRRR